MRIVLTTLVLVLALSAASAQPAQERRVALVIGVTQYDAVANLTNPRDGARQVYEALRATGFEVDEPLDSPTKAQLDAALQAFSRRADTADVALLYFAGHGMQQFDDNWLIPRNATLARPSDIVLEGVPLQNVVRLMAGARLRLIFLDACRNNPFSARWPSTMSPADGLAELPEAAVPAGTVLSYSAGPRQLAPDNGVFAQALAEHMQQEGVELRQVLDRVRRDVTRVTPSLNPTATIALNTAPFYFRGGPLPATATTPAVLTYVSPDQAPDARQTAPDVRAPLVRSEDVPRLRDFALFRECEACPEMVVLPAGRFLMGSPQDEVGREDDEDNVAGPGGEQVRVSVQSFAIGRFEATAEEWDACVDAGGGCYEGASGRRRLPNVQVSWNDVQTYLGWLNTQAGGGATLVSAGGASAYRLPSEAEWEYAVRAGTATAYAFGDDPRELPEHGWFGANAERRQHDVGGRRANPFGLYDMHGNVYEWVQDCYADSYAQLPGDGALSETGDCASRVLRGGSLFNSPQHLRSAFRYRDSPTYRIYLIGFRVARTL